MLLPRLALGAVFFAPMACFVTGEQPDIGAVKCTCPAAVVEANSSPGNEAPQRGGTIRIRIAEEPPSLLSIIDPLPNVKSIADHNVLEALVALSDDGLTPQPELALSWSISDAGKQYSFELDPQAHWHDGPPVTAADVKFTFSSLLDPDEGSVLRAHFADIERISVNGDRRIAFFLDAPRSDFLRHLAEVPIIPAHVFENSLLAVNPASRLPIGSGPFAVESWSPGRMIALVSQSSWRKERPLPDRVEYHIIADDRVAINLFRQGRIDIATQLPVSMDWMGSKGQMVYRPLAQVKLWMYNMEKSIFSNPHVRRSLGMLIDRQAIRCSIYRCRARLAEPAWPEEQLVFDPAKARELLDQQGWRVLAPGGIRQRGGIELSFALLVPEGDRDAAREYAVAREDFRKAGVEMRIETVSGATYLQRLAAREFDIAVTTSSVAAPAPPRDFPPREALDQLLFTFQPFAAFLVQSDIRGLAVANDSLSIRRLWRARWRARQRKQDLR